jgi:hypothetical protein
LRPERKREREKRWAKPREREERGFSLFFICFFSFQIPNSNQI